MNSEKVASQLSAKAFSASWLLLNQTVDFEVCHANSQIVWGVSVF